MTKFRIVEDNDMYVVESNSTGWWIPTNIKEPTYHEAFCHLTSMLQNKQYEKYPSSHEISSVQIEESS